MIDWNLTPENQVLYERVIARNKQLQQELGITSMTIEERATVVIAQKQKEEEFKKLLGNRRPPPKWKV